jgi:hypothetical protein
MTNTNFKETSLYKGKINIKFFPDTHIYYVNGKRKGSVTGALNIIDKSRALIPWAIGLYSDFLTERIGEKLTASMIAEGETLHSVRKKDAANVGTEAHDWIERFVGGENPEMPEDPRVVQAVNGFLNWVEEHDVRFSASEKVVYSMKHDYLGTMDAIATFGKGRKKYIIDYKASNGLYPGVALQTAAYMKADEEESGTTYHGRWAIRLSKETEEEYNERNLRKLNKWLEKNPGRDPYQIPPYTPFEARFLDEGYMKAERDFEAFIHALKLSKVHAEVDKEFFGY